MQFTPGSDPDSEREFSGPASEGRASGPGPEQKVPSSHSGPEIPRPRPEFEIPCPESEQEVPVLAVLRQAAVALLVSDLNHRIRLWSHGARNLLGYTPGEIIGRLHATLVPPDLLASDERILRDRVRAGEEVFFFTTERLHKDGRRIPVEVFRSIVSDPADGRPLAYSSIILDQTEKLAIQEKLLQAERMTALGRVVGKVFHELRTPLGVMVLQSEILSEEIEALIREAGDRATAARVSRIRETLGFISRETQRIESIGEDYLLMIRPVRAHRSDRCLGDLLDTVRAELESMCEQPGCEILVDSPNPDLVVAVDSFQMLRVFHNLAANSLEAMGAGMVPRLELQAEAEEGSLVFRFRDNGPGLPPELRDGTAFEIFTTTKTTGSGLGLHLVQEILEAHSGSIELGNHPEGGVEAVLRLPLAQEEDHA